MEKIEEYKDLMWNYIMENGTNILVAIVVYIIGIAVIKALVNGSKKVMDKQDFEPTLSSWLRTLISISLKAMLIISVLSMIGIEMTSFVAIIGAAGLAIGLALQGTLANFAGGVMVLLFKPYKVGDFIDGAGHMGSVKEIQIFNTILTTPDNKVIIIPNGQLATGSLTNFSKQETRRVDWTVGIAYGNDYDKAKEVISKMLEENPKVLKDPAYFVGLGALADSSVNVTVRAWVNAADYWDVFFGFNERVYKEFEGHGLEFPFPQMDVHVNQLK